MFRRSRNRIRKEGGKEGKWLTAEEEEGRRISHSSDRLNEAPHGGAALLPRIPRCETGTRERWRKMEKGRDVFSDNNTFLFLSVFNAVIVEHCDDDDGDVSGGGRRVGNRVGRP